MSVFDKIFGCILNTVEEMSIVRCCKCGRIIGHTSETVPNVESMNPYQLRPPIYCLSCETISIKSGGEQIPSTTKKKECHGTL